MNDKYILDAAGEAQPCADLFAWARWMEANHRNRHVADTYFGAVRISTVFLGLDHSFREIDVAMGLEPGPPILWESMVFGGPLDGEQVRYATRAEADAGHTLLCQAVVRALESPASIDAVDPHGNVNTGTPPTRDKKSS